MKKLRFSAVACTIMIIMMCMGSVSATDLNTTVLPDYHAIYVNTSNDGDLTFDTNNNSTYYIQALSSPQGGFNAVHIANDSVPPNLAANDKTNYGQFTNTTNLSGVFYATDTGGRGYQDLVVLMLAVNGTIPDDFAVHIKASGYTWTPTGVMNAAPLLNATTYQTNVLDETFTKEDFLYGPQNWKPTGGNVNYSIFSGQNMNDTSTMFHLMFIDTGVGMLGSNYPYTSTSNLIDYGSAKIEYSFENLQSLAVFNIYAWNWNTSQGQGMLWTNSILPGNTGGPSGYAVRGTSAPIANFVTNTTTGTVPLTVHFTDTSTGAQPLTYTWDFGDGDTSHEQNPTHTYDNTGTYTAKLTVTNKLGSSQKTSTIIVTLIQVLANLETGSYNRTQQVRLTAVDPEDPSPRIYYTLNGSEPTTSSTLYTGPITIDTEGTTVMKFKAFDRYGNSSNTVTKTYLIDMTAPTVTATPTGNTYHTLQNVTLNAVDNCDTNPVIYYTTDGTDPINGVNRVKYTTPINISTTTTVKYAAVDFLTNWSQVYTQKYTMVDVESPTVSVDIPGGFFDKDQVLKLTATDELDPHPKIYYTTNGTEPTVNSTLYDWPISVNIVGTTILKFFAMDAAGHVSNITTQIYYLDKVGSSGTWNSTLVDGNTIMYNSIAMDSSGKPHIAYYQLASSGTDWPQLKYAYWNGSGWHIETVESTRSGSGFFISLALDSQNKPHIAYREDFGSDNPNMFKYAYKDASGWHITILASSYPENIVGDDLFYLNLVLYQDQPRISYYNNTGGYIQYTYKNGTNWVTEKVAPSGGRWNSLVIGEDGTPHISFYSISQSSYKGSLRYAVRNSDGTWKMTIVDNYSDYVGLWNSIALDSAGNPRISYCDFSYSGGSLKYAYWNGAYWVTETVDNLDSSASKLILTQSDTPIIVYRDLTTNALKYAYLEGSNWRLINIDTIEGAGNWISLFMDYKGVPYVSYSTSSSRLKYAYLVPFKAGADPVGGTYYNNQTLNLTSTPGTTIYYTLDESDPRTSTTRKLYSSTLQFKNTTTIKFAAKDSASNWSPIYTETYVIIDTIAPTVVSTNPTNSAVNVLPTTVITLNFTENIYNGNGWVELKTSNGTSMPFTKSISGKVLTITPSSALSSGVKYQVLIHSGALTDLAGNMVSSYLSTFTVTNVSIVVGVDPANGAVDVSTGKVIRVTYSGDVKWGNGWVELKTSNGTSVAFSKSVSGKVLTITPSSALSSGVKYLVLIHSGALTNLVGNSVSSYLSTFTVVSVPTVSAVDPASGAVDVSTGKVIRVTYSGDVKLGNGWIELKTSNGTSVAFSKSVTGKVLTITPSSALSRGVKYQVLIHSGALTDLAGYGVSSYLSTFTVASVPSVSAVDPVNGAVGVSTGKVIRVTFSGDVKLGNGWIELKTSNGTSVAFSKSVTGKVLIITPSSALSRGVKYQVLIHSGALTDLAGYGVSSYLSTFTVASVPSVSAVDPVNGAVGVSTGKVIQVTFSDDVKLGNGWIELKTSNGTSVAFSKSVTGKVLTITPSSALSRGVKYQVLIHSGALTDLAGNPVNSYLSTFTC